MAVLEAPTPTLAHRGLPALPMPMLLLLPVRLPASFLQCTPVVPVGHGSMHVPPTSPVGRIRAHAAEPYDDGGKGVQSAVPCAFAAARLAQIRAHHSVTPARVWPVSGPQCRNNNARLAGRGAHVVTSWWRNILTKHARTEYAQCTPTHACADASVRRSSTQAKANGPAFALHGGQWGRVWGGGLCAGAWGPDDLAPTTRAPTRRQPLSSWGCAGDCSSQFPSSNQNPTIGFSGAALGWRRSIGIT